jgi:transposase-like protein
MTLLDLLNKEEQGADPSFLRDGVRLLAQELMDAEVTQLAGAGLHERSENPLTYRNGYREREWDTRVGTVDHILSCRLQQMTRERAPHRRSRVISCIGRFGLLFRGVLDALRAGFTPNWRPGLRRGATT